MIRNQFRKFVSLLIISTFSISCGYSEAEAIKYLPGIYTYKLPSGELQELKINYDFSFTQKIYSKNGLQILYENEGKMYIKSNNIEFEHWLECYDLAEQKLLNKPYLSNTNGPFWIKEYRNEPTKIIFFDQNNYIFEKRHDIPS